jgi:hypothetical protein
MIEERTTQYPHARAGKFTASSEAPTYLYNTALVWREAKQNDLIAARRNLSYLYLCYPQIQRALEAQGA